MAHDRAKSTSSLQLGLNVEGQRGSSPVFYCFVQCGRTSVIRQGRDTLASSDYSLGPPWGVSMVQLAATSKTSFWWMETGT